MATNREPGDNRRHGAVRNRTQFFNTKTQKWVKRNRETGVILDVKQDGTPFKGVTVEKDSKKHL